MTRVVSIPHWQVSAVALPLSSNDVQLWRVLIDPSGDVTSPHPLLSEDEVRRLQILRNPADQLRFTAGHAALRVILAACLKTEPSSIHFDRALHGKPQIVRLDGWPDVRFSLAHSGDVVLVAVTIGTEVGVDVERIRDLPDAMRLAERFLGADVASAVSAASPEDRSAVLLRAWTRVEAYLKITGAGLSGLQSGAGLPAWVTEPDGAGYVETARRHERLGDATAVTSFGPASGYVGALCCSAPASIRWLDFVAPWR
jgi:4'-phosphopantetheinyl transferase